MKKIILSTLLAAPFVFVSPMSSADDQKSYVGSNCGFADFPLASHNKIHHRLKNTSGRSQWVTCPIVRDSVKHSVEWASMDTVGTVSHVRLEFRGNSNGSLSGWNANGATYTGGTGRQHYWFNGDAKGTPWNYSSLALEVFLGNDAYINSYRVVEKN